MITSVQGCFDDVPRDARGHLGLLYYRAACMLILYVQQRARSAGKPAHAAFEEFPFLYDYWDELRARLPEELEPESIPSALDQECEAWEQASADWLPLRALREDAGMSSDALVCWVLAGIVEEDARFAALFSALQQPLGHRRPTLGLIELATRAGRDAGAHEAWAHCHPMLESGLLEALNRDAPRSEWVLRVPPAIWNAVCGHSPEQPLPATHYHAPSEFQPIADLILPDHQQQQIVALVPLLRSRGTRALAVRGTAGSERLELVGSLASALGLGLLELDASTAIKDDLRKLIGPLCTLIRAMPVFSLELGPGETFDVPTLPVYRGPIAVIMGIEGGLSGAASEQCLTLNLEPENLACRLRHWRRALHGDSADDLERFASRFLLPARYIRQAAPLAKAYAALEGRSSITESDVRRAARTINRQRLDSLATRLEEAGDWSRLVVSSATDAALQALEQRCCHREELAGALGGAMPGGLNRGVRALFEGPSGSGKTLAARVLASALGTDVYRVDLAAVVNKYIGETEKNLSRVLSRAEDLDIVLLLDEGDALMTRRTEVKSAHDRYANLETNYLLQRLETYTGIVIVTTNVGGHIDSAFRRRIDVVVKFHLPDAEQRWRLWRLHLPADHAIQDDALEQVAMRYALSGGQIRNAAIHATMLSMNGGPGRVTLETLMRAIHTEHRKAGAAFSSCRDPAAGDHHGKLASFMAAIS